MSIARYEEDNFQQIIKYLEDKTGNVKLTQEQEQLLERANFADDQLRTPKVASQVVPIIRKKFNVSRATAYRDINRAKKLFNYNNKFDKEYYRDLLIQLNYAALNRAIAKQDSRSEAMILRNLENLGAFDKSDAEVADAESFKQQNIMIVTNPKDIGIEPPDKSPEDLLEELQKKTKQKDDERININTTGRTQSGGSE